MGIMGSSKDLGLKSMRGRIPALKHLDNWAIKVQENIELVKSLEYGTYIGTFKDKRWVSNGSSTGAIMDTSSEIFCEIIGINKESVKVNILTMKHHTTIQPYELSRIRNSHSGTISITFEKFKEFKRKDLELSEVPLYLNLDYVSKDLAKKYLM